MSISEIIKKSPLFQNISLENIKSLSQGCHEKKFAKGSDIFSMGDPADAFFSVVKGWVKLYRMSKDGEEMIVHIFGPGETFAEAAVFNTTQSYPVNAQALEDLTLIEIPRHLFVQKIKEDSQFALSLLGAIASRQHRLVQQLEQITTRTAPQRVGAFLIRFCQKEKEKEGWVINLPYDKSVISTRLNIKPETFSRALSQLEDYGVRRDHKKIVIKDIHLLADYCDISPLLL